MKRIILIASIVVVLLIGAAAVIPFLVPESVYKAQIEKAATNALGREVTVAGNVSISIFPGISASVEDVSVANPDGFPEPNMIEAGALKGSVRLWPLFSRKVEVNKIEFVDAKVGLTRLENGDVNWIFAGGEESAPDGAGSGDSVETSVEKFSLENASLTYSDLQTGTRYELTEFNAETGFKSLASPVNLKADGKFQGKAFSTRADLSSVAELLDAKPANVDFEFDSDLGKTSFAGTIINAEAVSVDGKFSASAPQLAAIADFLDLKLPVNLAPLGALQIEGQAKGTFPALQITFDKLSLAADGFSAGYQGSVVLGDQLTLNGAANVTARDISALSKSMGIDQPALAPFQQLNFTSQVSGTPEALNFANTNFQTNSPTLQASYKGDLSTSGPGKIDGDISFQSDQFRTALSQMGVELPPGDTLKAINVSGRARGTLQKALVENGTFKIDDIQATGSLGGDLTSGRPKLTANLDTDTLDLSPFLGEQKTQGNAEPGWSDAPLDLNGLKLADADIKLRAKAVRIGDVVLSDADVESTLIDGRFDANLKTFKAFNGVWTGRMGVDSSSSIPTYRFNMTAADIAAQNLLGTFANFNRLAGDGAFSIDVASSGTTMNQIVNKLSGTAGLDLEDGSLAGVNLGQLVRTASTLTGQLASGQLTLASLGDVVSPQAKTDFTSFKTQLQISNGVANVESMNLINSVLDVTGTGQLNLGGQSIDLKLTPAIDRTGQGTASTVKLNGIPIPLRISGSWAAPKFSPDFSGVSSALQSSARQQAIDAIAGGSSGQVGEIVSGVLGVKPKAPQTPEGPADSTDEAPTEEPEKDATEEAVKNALGALFGPN